MADTNSRINELRDKLHLLMDVFDFRAKKEKIKELEIETSRPDFWSSPDAASRVSEELASLKKTVEDFENLEVELELLVDAGDNEAIAQALKKLEAIEQIVFLSGKYDRENAILTIHSGAGGQDAQDWGAMLLRMYNRYCERKGFKTAILHESFGDGVTDGRVGYKEVSVYIKGLTAYGYLKKETGVHRLVRLSPFNAKHLRQTSFALVEVYPEFPKSELKNLELKPEDLRIDFYRSSGPGGQYVNKRESAVRITHIPTGIFTTCQTERVQGQNRDRAMELLKMKLFQLMRETRETELSKIKGERVSASWSNQIRNYVLDPYKLVKDTRTGVETTQVDEVLDGELDKFIEAEIKLA
ncbi:MAG: peptide chain release factor 2 [Candidatus Nealsonbacteria bacterium DGGOD1a]|nr:MAG: peptide chain release factor 2 [Candidatus Nealsonbacteria bacterium DGGOD1a]